MVKHTLAWALLVMTSLGAVYSMSHAATQADSTFESTIQTPIITPPPQKPVREESGLEYFRFRNGYLEWKIQHIYSKYDLTKEKFAIRCYGRTKYLDLKRKDFIEEINNEFSGLLTMTPEDEEGYAEGRASITLRPTEMRYNLICGWFSKEITVTPRDWPSNIYAKEFKTLNEITASSKAAGLTASSAKEKSATKKYISSSKGIADKNTARLSESIQKPKPIPDEYVAIASAGGRLTTKLIPGSKDAIIAAFTLTAKKKMRIKAITFNYTPSLPPWKKARITIDGKDPDSMDASGGKNQLHWSGLGDYGLFDTVMPGKHLIEIKACIKNPKGKSTPIAFKVTGIVGVTGLGSKIKLKSPVQLQTHTVPYNKDRTKKEDEYLCP
ncbi:MAG: hypothetical protein AAB400_03010 [Patescibacteria group bacterium]